MSHLEPVTENASDLDLILDRAAEAAGPGPLRAWLERLRDSEEVASSKEVKAVSG